MRIVFAVILFLFCSMDSFSRNKVILTTHSQPPLTYLNENGVLDGVAVKPVVYALKRMGWGYEFRILPWARAQVLAKSGEADGFFAASKNSERDEFAAASEPVTTQRWNWYLLKESTFDPRSPDFKEKAKVGGYIGSNMLKWLKDNNFNIAGEPVVPDQLFFMLDVKRFDACLANSYNYDNFIKNNKQYKDKFKFFTEQSNSLYVYFSKKFIQKNPEFLPQFNRYVKEYTTKYK